MREWLSIVEARYQGSGWWLIALSCGHQWRVLHGIISPLQSAVKGCIQCERGTEQA